MFLRILIVSLLVSFAAFGAHEMTRLLLIYALGSSGSITARTWQLGYVDFAIWSFAAQPSAQLDLVRQSIADFFGPFLAAVPFAALLWYVRQPIPRAALAVNVAILVFYSVVDLLHLLLKQVWATDVPLLTAPEFSYGVPLAMIVLTALGLWVYDARFGGTRIPE